MTRLLYPRLQTFGYPGDPSPPAFSFHITSEQAWQRAKEIGAITNLVRYREAEGDEGAQGISFPYTIVYPQAWSEKSAWQPLTAKALAHFEEGLSPFRGDVTALGFTNNEVSSSPLYRSNPSASIVTKNGAFSLRLRLAKAPKEQEIPIWSALWDRWQFNIIDGKADIRIQSNAWTQAQDDALDALQSLESRTAEQETQMQEIAATIYEQVVYLDNLQNSEQWYNTPFVVTFIPEERGLLTIRLEGGSEQVIKREKILETRAPGVMWEASPLTIRATDGVFYWQPGYPAATSLTGEARLFKYKTGYWTDSLNAMEFNSLASTPAGTSITLENVALNAVWSQIVARFTTSDRRVWPWLYSAYATIPAGARVMDTDTHWDSDDHLMAPATSRDGATTPISDVEISHEGSDRRLQVQMTIADPNGRTFKGAGFNYASIEHRLATFGINGRPLITRGVVKEVTQNDMNGATYNQPRILVTRGSTSVTATLVDIWGLLEDLIIYGYPVGDGMRLGAYIRLLLQNAGFSTAEMAGVDASMGRILPRAALGEEPAIVPGEGVSYAEYLRSIVDKWGMGLALRMGRDGIWYLGYPDTTTLKAEFRRLANLPVPRSGIIKPIIEPLDLVIDNGDFYNYYKVVGAKPELAAEWYIWESIRGTTGALPRNYLGRVKPYPVVQDDGLRTPDDVNWVLQSLVMKYGKPGRYWEFGSEYSDDLFPGDLVAVENTYCELSRLSSATLDDDYMKVAAREAA